MVSRTDYGIMFGDAMQLVLLHEAQLRTFQGWVARVGTESVEVSAHFLDQLPRLKTHTTFVHNFEALTHCLERNSADEAFRRFILSGELSLLDRGVTGGLFDLLASPAHRLHDYIHFLGAWTKSLKAKDSGVERAAKCLEKLEKLAESIDRSIESAGTAAQAEVLPVKVGQVPEDVSGRLGRLLTWLDAVLFEVEAGRLVPQSKVGAFVHAGGIVLAACSTERRAFGSLLFPSYVFLKFFDHKSLTVESVADPASGIVELIPESDARVVLRFETREVAVLFVAAIAERRAALDVGRKSVSATTTAAPPPSARRQRPAPGKR
jgi:hypothetical protein